MALRVEGLGRVKASRSGAICWPYRGQNAKFVVHGGEGNASARQLRRAKVTLVDAGDWSSSDGSRSWPR